MFSTQIATIFPVQMLTLSNLITSKFSMFFLMEVQCEMFNSMEYTYSFFHTWINDSKK